jgi:hypothetical protein
MAPEVNAYQEIAVSGVVLTALITVQMPLHCPLPKQPVI